MSCQACQPKVHAAAPLCGITVELEISKDNRKKRSKKGLPT